MVGVLHIKLVLQVPGGGLPIEGVLEVALHGCELGEGSFKIALGPLPMVLGVVEIRLERRDHAV